MTDSSPPASTPPLYPLYDYYEQLLQEAYDRGEFEPRGKRQHKSGLVIDFLVPPRYDEYLDGPGF